MTCGGASGEQIAGTLHGAHAAAHPAGEPTGDLPHEREVVAHPHGRVQVDHLHLGEALEALHPSEYVVVSDREPLALDELDDRAVP